MPHQCVHCGKIYPDASKELLEGCSCGSHFFLFIRKEPKKDKLKPKEKIETIKAEKIIDFDVIDKKQIEKDIREIIGLEEEKAPIILDLESIKVLGPGKFQIDIVNLFNKKRPLIYKLEEGKYIIDLASSLKINLDKFMKEGIK